MDIESLDMFIETARRLSFAEVARARGIHPSIVSRTIQNLETNIGVTLFIRTTRRMILSDPGRAFLKHAERTVQSAQAAVEAAHCDAREPSGTVRITASTAFGERVLVPLLHPLKERFPEIIIHLMLTDERLDLLDTGVDLALRLGPSLTGDMVGRKLFETRYHICASPEYLSKHSRPQCPDDLSFHSVINYDLPAYRNSWRFRSVTGEETSVEVQAGTVLSSALAVRQAALMGLGPALLADWLVADALASGALIDLFPDHQIAATDFRTAVWLAYPSSSIMTRRVRAVADFLIDRLSRPS